MQLTRARASAENIGPLGRARRQRLGVLSAVGGVLLLAALVRIDATQWLALIAIVPFGGAALGILEARGKTDVALAWRGARNPDDGEEPVVHSAERYLLRKQARRILGWSSAAGMSVALLAYVML